MATVIDVVDFAAYLKGPEEEANVRDPSSYTAEVVSLFNDESAGYGALLPWPKTHEYVRVRPGEVSVWAGFNGSGKSLLLSQAMFGFMTQGQKVCLASLEMPPPQTLKRMVCQASTLARPSDKYIEKFGEWTDGKLYLYNQQGTVKVDRILQLARYSHQKLGCDHLVVDSMMKCGIGVEDYDAQKDFIDQLTAHAMATKQHVHLVAHSRKKMSEADRVGKMDVKGAGEIIDQVDNLYIVWRNKPKEEAKRNNDPKRNGEPDCVFSCEKQRHGRPGSEGSWGLSLNLAAQCYVDAPFAHPTALVLDTGRDAVPF